jgi:hypothetical protein
VSWFKQDGLTKPIKGPASLTMQSAFLIAPLIDDLLNDPDIAIQGMGTETTDVAQTYHFVLSNTFNSSPDLKDFSKLTQRDLWIDTSTRLPVRLSYAISTGAGPADVTLPVVIDYSDFSPNRGVTIPHHINVSLNGTQWLSVSITTVSVNSGVSLSDFQLN